jgi:hypothetical protein
MISIHIYSPIKSPKLRYVFDFIFETFNEIQYTLHSDYDSFSIVENALKINYSDQVKSGMVNIPLSHFYNDGGHIAFERDLKYENDLFNFDFIASIFYLLCRIEEYDNPDVDLHGRYKAQSSILYQKGFLDIPVIDYWIKSFIDTLSNQHTLSIGTTSKYSIVSTVDVDHIYAYRAKPIGTQIGSFFKDLLKLDFLRIKDRLDEQDPYDTYDYIDQCHLTHGLESKYFILCSNKTQYDRSLPHDNSTFRKVVSDLDKRGSIGIHPSYDSMHNKKLIADQKKDLESVINGSITASRQHFLRMQLPQTYEYLIQCEISSDYTMGYAHNLGFRSGTSRSYKWYNVTEDKVTSLTIHPFSLMDVTLRRVSDNDPLRAKEIAKKLIDTINAVDGVFCLIWHNSSFYSSEGWKGWDKVYEEILSYAKSYLY